MTNLVKKPFFEEPAGFAGASYTLRIKTNMQELVSGMGHMVTVLIC